MGTKHAHICLHGKTTYIHKKAHLVVFTLFCHANSIFRDFYELLLPIIPLWGRFWVPILFSVMHICIVINFMQKCQFSPNLDIRGFAMQRQYSFALWPNCFSNKICLMQAKIVSVKSKIVNKFPIKF